MYVEDGVKCTVAKFREGNEVSGDEEKDGEEEEDKEKTATVCPYYLVSVRASLCLSDCVLMFLYVCPYA